MYPIKGRGVVVCVLSSVSSVSSSSVIKALRDCLKNLVNAAI